MTATVTHVLNCDWPKSPGCSNQFIGPVRSVGEASTLEEVRREAETLGWRWAPADLCPRHAPVEES